MNCVQVAGFPDESFLSVSKARTRLDSRHVKLLRTPSSTLDHATKMSQSQAKADFGIWPTFITAFASRKVINSLLDVAAAQAHETPIAELVTVVLLAKGQQHLFAECVKRELMLNAHKELLFRGQSLFSQCCISMLQHLCKDFLDRVVPKISDFLRHRSKHIFWCIEEAQCDDSEQLFSSRKDVLNAVTSVLKIVDRHLMYIPEDASFFFRELLQVTELVHPGFGSTVALSTFFLRVVCPGLVAPRAHLRSKSRLSLRLSKDATDRGLSSQKMSKLVGVARILQIAATKAERGTIADLEFWKTMHDSITDVMESIKTKLVDIQNTTQFNLPKRLLGENHVEHCCTTLIKLFRRHGYTCIDGVAFKSVSDVDLRGGEAQKVFSPRCARPSYSFDNADFDDVSSSQSSEDAAECHYHGVEIVDVSPIFGSFLTTDSTTTSDSSSSAARYMSPLVRESIRKSRIRMLQATHNARTDRKRSFSHFQ